MTFEPTDPAALMAYAARRDLGSYRRLAKASGISHATVGHIMVGRRGASTESAHAISQALGVPVDVFFTAKAPTVMHDSDVSSAA